MTICKKIVLNPIFWGKYIKLDMYTNLFVYCSKIAYTNFSNTRNMPNGYITTAGSVQDTD